MKDTSLGASREALFCIGSNCGDREGNVDAALAWLSGILADFRHTPVYATPDCHGGVRKYMNAVAAGRICLDAPELERLCKDYECEAGRDAKAREAGDVPIDIDIVIFDGKILREKDFGCEFFKKGYKWLLNLE